MDKFSDSIVERYFTPMVVSVLLIIAIVQLFVFDFAYTYNWCDVNDHAFARFSKLSGQSEMYSFGEMLAESDNYFLIAVLLIPAWIYLRGVVIMKYLLLLLLDFLVVAYIFVFTSNPFYENWDKTKWIIISIVLFLIKCIFIAYSNYRLRNKSA